VTDGADGPRFVTAIDAGQSVVSASGELDLASVEQLRDVLSPLSGQVIIDLSMVTYLDSSAIGVLVGALNRLIRDGGTLRFRRPNDVPRRVLQLTGLGDLIDN
jgi:anti-sigma B factor antagonist